MAPSLFMFERKGSIVIRSEASTDEVFEAAVEAGAEDVHSGKGEDGVLEHEIVTAPDDLADVARALAKLGQATRVEHVYAPAEDMRVEIDGREDIEQLVEMLEEDADVVRVTINAA